jgi:FkbM family methyltransferase
MSRFQLVLGLHRPQTARMSPMYQIPALIISDFLGLCRVCGVGVGIRWLLCVARTINECRHARNLQPADLAMGEGPFRARLGSARARLTGTRVVSGIREIWVRDTYLGGGFLHIPLDAVVVDLGCNMGNFTLLALGHGPGVRVVCVEADRGNIEKVNRSLAVNNWSDRAQVINGFIGGTTAFQAALEASETGAGVPHLSAESFLRRTGLTRIDFLKCDIEGSEFDLLMPDSPLLAITDQLAIEVHTSVGSTASICSTLRTHGFEVKVAQETPGADIVLARRL